KAEYFASAFEGLLVVVAAAGIANAATSRFLHPRPLEEPGIGLGLTAVASGLNFAVARVLMRDSRRHRSIALEADAHHLMRAVWTSAGVILGVTLRRPLRRDVRREFWGTLLLSLYGAPGAANRANQRTLPMALPSFSTRTGCHFCTGA